jgi:cytochrome c biogenesis protein CcmG/thiol:disulfide interchange protein DsbE
MLSRILPLSLFVLLGILLAAGLKLADTKSHIPSPLIGKPVPEFNLPLLFEPETLLNQKDFLGQPYLVNFWASWCVTCVVEHPVLEQLAAMDRIRIIGFNFRDEPEDAMQWLAKYGDPYDLHVTDYQGRTSINFGVYAAPESFLVNPQGEVVYKHIGALTMEIIEQRILPMVADMERKG